MSFEWCLYALKTSTVARRVFWRGIGFNGFLWEDYLRVTVEWKGEMGSVTLGYGTREALALQS